MKNTVEKCADCGHRMRWMCPIYGDHRGTPAPVCAPTLFFAFSRARTNWPTADGWECLGDVSAVDGEVCEPTGETGTIQSLVTEKPADPLRAALTETCPK